MIELTPEEFTLVFYDAAEVRSLVEAAAARAGLDDVVVQIDEELPLPITGTFVDVVDGRASVWISGGSLEDPKNPQELEHDVAAEELTIAMLRAADRSGAGFADAPADRDLTERDRASWDTWASGRAERLGVTIRVPRAHYGMRLHHGFTDVADAAFERLWAADALTWADLVAIGEDTAAVDPRPAPRTRAPVRKPDMREKV